MIKINLLCNTARVPTKGTPNSAGYDLYSCEHIEIPYGTVVAVSTGIAVQLENADEHIKVCSRSGLATCGIFLINAPGIIDNDYRGEIKCLIMNLKPDKASYMIHNGDRIAQLLINKTISHEFEVVEELDSTIRGAGGFGSTGKQ